jgi:ABC-2 type transport system permease protein
MSGLTGTGWLLRLAVRRDRVTLAAWLLGMAAFTAGTAAMSVQGLPTHEDVVQETRLAAGNAGLRMLGLASGPTVGAYVMVRDFVTLAVLAGLMSTLTVVRHTRQDEELGRAELLGAGVVGRYAGLAAAVLLSLAANLLLAVLVGGALVATGLPVAGSLCSGAAVASVGVAFTGVAALTSQLAGTSRGATGLAGAALGLAFLLSGAGNMLGTPDRDGLRVTSAWPAWLSPIGWGQQLRPFDAERWTVLALPVLLAGVLVVVAAGLVRRRDVGRGLWPERRGAATARPGLRVPAGLAWRLERGAVLGWAVALLGFGLVFGALSGQLDDLGERGREWYAEMGGSDRILDAYRASIVAMAGMAVAAFTVQMLLRLRTHELDGTLEPVLATRVTRTGWVLGHVVDVALASLVLLLVFAWSMVGTSGEATGSLGARLPDLTVAALVQVPAVLVVGGAVLAAVGTLPRWAAAVSWGLFLVWLLLGPMFAPTFDLPGWARDLSPFSHVPNVPAGDVSVAPLVGLTAVGLALGLVGLTALRRRDAALPA